MTTTTGQPPSRLGARPGAAVRSGCGTCGHPKALHSNGDTPCRAFSCTAGPDGGPCQQFTKAKATIAA